MVKERERAMIFVDHANVYMNLINLNCHIDYEKFKNVLTQYSHLVAAFMFMGLPKKIPNDLKKFISYLKKAGYIIQPKPLQVAPNGKKRQKGIDLFMYKEIVELAEADAYDKAIIVSGDADFIEAVRKLKELKKEFVIWSFKVSLAQKLIEEAGRENIHYIDTILEYIEIPEDDN